MRVLCINDNGWYEERKLLFFTRKVKGDGPGYGDINNVTGQYYDNGMLCYELLEWPPKTDKDGFEADCFIPLSEVDEMELVNENFNVNVQ